MGYPKRKRNRLEHYDYSSPGAYFVTICTFEKKKLFWSDHVLDSIASPSAVQLPFSLSETGALVDKAIQNIPLHYTSITIDRYVIMPNHVHLLLQIHEQPEGNFTCLQTVIGQMKRWTSKQAEFPIWQKSFHEHVVRNKNDYLEIWSYIDSNPIRWQDDCYFETGG